MTKKSWKICFSSVLLVFALLLGFIPNTFNTVKADSTSATFTPVSQYLNDTNYNVPSDFWSYKSNVTYGTVKSISYYSTATNSTRSANVLLPAGYNASDTSTKYPVMYMLHGIGGDQHSLLSDNVNLVIGNAIASGAAEKMIVVFPNACANATGQCPSGASFFSLAHYSAYDNFINDFKNCLMPYINSHFNAAEGRENTAISGFSMGGRVALQIGFTLSDQVRYTGAFCPAPGIFACSDNGVTMSGLFSQASFTLPSKYMNDTLAMIVAGKNDTVVKYFPETYHNALTANGVPHIWYTTLGGVNNTGNGQHGSDVYKHGLYNFIRRIFHRTSTSSSASSSSASSSSSGLGEIELQMYNGNTQSSINGIMPRFKLINKGSTTIDLSKVKLRYYYTENGNQSQNFWCDWSSIGSANVTGSFKTLSPAKTCADNYLEIGFTSSAGTLAAGSSIEVQARFSKNDWMNYVQSDDYSFDSTGASYADWNKVTAYYNDTIAWGVEP